VPRFGQGTIEIRYFENAVSLAVAFSVFASAAFFSASVSKSLTLPARLDCASALISRSVL
jgi:hypothetical protein